MTGFKTFSGTAEEVDNQLNTAKENCRVTILTSCASSGTGGKLFITTYLQERTTKTFNKNVIKENVNSVPTVKEDTVVPENPNVLPQETNSSES
jgi:hypothetical protein